MNMQKKKITITMILIVIILLVFQCCSNSKTEQQKRQALEKIEEVIMINTSDLNMLLSRADLCSKSWFEDLEVYIARLEEQNQWLQSKQEEKYQVVYQIQMRLLTQLKEFAANQNEETVNQLEEVVMAYQSLVEGK